MSQIKKLREAMGWSRSELARQSGLHASTIGQIENGRLIPYDRQIEKIAEALQVDPSVLREGQPEPKTQAAR